METQRTNGHTPNQKTDIKQSGRIHSGLKWVKVFTRPKHRLDPLTFSERLIYSFLAARCLRAFSIRRIAQYTGLNKDSIKPVLEKLLSHNLVGQTPTFRWFGREPDEVTRSWFIAFKTEGEWQKRFGYWRWYVPSQENPLTPKQQAVFCLLSSFRTFSGPHGLAKILGFSLNTVKTALDKFAKHGLVKRDGKTYFVLEMPEQCKAWYLPENKLSKVLKLVPKACSSLDRAMKAAKFTDGELFVCRPLIGRLISETLVTEVDLERLLEKAGTKHDPARFPGSCARLFISFLKEEIEKRDLAERVMRECPRSVPKEARA